ncbi:MAG: hypothetical protein ACI379_14430 [Nocardioides sp.]|uniref:hypothetical protein n=1 Tax=Nocardioides sp. TaxID=35761 RepID=UPI003EFD245F
MRVTIDREGNVAFVWFELAPGRRWVASLAVEEDPSDMYVDVEDADQVIGFQFLDATLLPEEWVAVAEDVTGQRVTFAGLGINLAELGLDQDRAQGRDD